MKVTVTVKKYAFGQANNGIHAISATQSKPITYLIYAEEIEQVARHMESIWEYHHPQIGSTDRVSKGGIESAFELNTSALCTYLKVNERTVRRWRSRSLIPFVKIRHLVRFDSDEVVKALESKKGGRV